MNGFLTRLSPIVAAATLALGSAASAQSTVAMAGWQTWGGTANTQNSSYLVNVPSGVAGVTSVSYSIDFTSLGGSWRSEFVIRVEIP